MLCSKQLQDINFISDYTCSVCLPVYDLQSVTCGFMFPLKSTKYGQGRVSINDCFSLKYDIDTLKY